MVTITVLKDNPENPIGFACVEFSNTEAAQSALRLNNSVAWASDTGTPFANYRRPVRRASALTPYRHKADLEQQLPSKFLCSHLARSSLPSSSRGVAFAVYRAALLNILPSSRNCRIAGRPLTQNANETEIPLLHGHNGTLNENGTSIEEERRLLYVAMTRARKNLFMLYVIMDSNWQVLQPSRFLREIPHHLLETQVAFAIDERLRAKKCTHKDVLRELKSCLTSEESYHFAVSVVKWEQIPAEKRAHLMREKQEHFQKLRVETAMSSSEPTPKQIAYLQSLGCTTVPTSRLQASRLIEEYKSL